LRGACSAIGAMDLIRELTAFEAALHKSPDGTELPQMAQEIQTQLLDLFRQIREALNNLAAKD
jgi:hypothetical protein